MNTHSLCCIGYITQDKVVTPKNTIYMPGGTSFYFAHAIKHLNANDFLLVTALADTDMGIVEDISERRYFRQSLAQHTFRLFREYLWRKSKRTYTTCHGKSRPFHRGRFERYRCTDYPLGQSACRRLLFGGHQVLVRQGTPLGRRARISPQGGEMKRCWP